MLATGEKGEFFEEQKKIHGEFKNLGNTLMALENQGVYHSKDLMPFGKYGQIYQTYADNIADSTVLAGDLPIRTSVGQMQDADGNIYLLVLNREFEKPLQASIPLKMPCHIYEVSKTDGRQSLLDTSDKLNIQLDPGDAVLLRVQNAANEPFTAEYKLR